MIFKDNLFHYLYMKSESIDSYYDLLRNNFRVIDADEMDYIELLIARNRRDLMREVTKDVVSLLHVK